MKIEYLLQINGYILQSYNREPAYKYIDKEVMLVCKKAKNIRNQIKQNRKYINVIKFEIINDYCVIHEMNYLKLIKHRENSKKLILFNKYTQNPTLQELKPRYYSKEYRIAIFNRDKYTCQYCGWKNGTDKGDRILHIDHIVPVYSGGTSTLANLITSCYLCNITKGNKSIFKESNQKSRESVKNFPLDTTKPTERKEK